MKCNNDQITAKYFYKINWASMSLMDKPYLKVSYSKKIHIWLTPFLT